VLAFARKKSASHAHPPSGSGCAWAGSSVSGAQASVRFISAVVDDVANGMELSLIDIAMTGLVMIALTIASDELGDDEVYESSLFDVDVDNDAAMLEFVYATME
jgi:hypothetical protein